MRIAAALGSVFATLALLAGFVVGAQAQVPSQPDIVQSSPWVCNAPQNRELVKLTLNTPSNDAIQFRSGCTGRIGRVEVEGAFADCFKVNPPEPPAHDVVIESGFCHVTGPPASGVHQDCIQAGGGSDFLIRNFVFDCIGGGGGNYFIAAFNGGSPRNFICDHCAFGPRHPNQIRTPSDPASGVSNSLVCQSFSGRAVYSPASGDKGGNVSPPAGSPECSWEGLLAFVGGGDPPPPPPPDDPPPPPDEPYNPACAPTCDEQIAALQAENDALEAKIAAALAALSG